MYLVKRDTTYHFRFKIPKTLQPIMGKTELRQSLNTGDKRLAQRKAYILAGQILSELEEGGGSSRWATEKPSQSATIVSPDIQTIFNEYIAELELQNVRPQTVNTRRSMFNRLLELVGTKRINSYNRQDAKRFRQKLLDSGNAPTTMNSNLKNVNVFWNWAVAEGYSHNNPFTKLGVVDSRKENELAKAYSKSQLAVMFADNFEKDNFRYWMPRLAAYTGARIKELAQLYLDDVETINGILCIHIRDKHADQHLKNKNSRRVIPVHSSLVEDLLERVDQLKREGHERLFPDISYQKTNGYAGVVSRWWSDYNKLEGYTFHSFRHTVANELKQQGVEEKYISALLGHSHGSITHNRYGKDYKPELLQPIVERLQWL